MCKILKILDFLLKSLWEATLKKAFVCIGDSKLSYLLELTICGSRVPFVLEIR